MHPALRKGSLFYEKKIIFHFSTTPPISFPAYGPAVSIKVGCASHPGATNYMSGGVIDSSTGGGFNPPPPTIPPSTRTLDVRRNAPPVHFSGKLSCRHSSPDAKDLSFTYLVVFVRSLVLFLPPLLWL